MWTSKCSGKWREEKVLSLMCSLQHSYLLLSYFYINNLFIQNHKPQKHHHTQNCCCRKKSLSHQHVCHPAWCVFIISAWFITGSDSLPLSCTIHFESCHTSARHVHSFVPFFFQFNNHVVKLICFLSRTVNLSFIHRNKLFFLLNTVPIKFLFQSHKSMSNFNF